MAVTGAVAGLHMHFWGSVTEQDSVHALNGPKRFALVCLISRMRAVLTAVDSMVQRLFAAD